MDELLRKLHIVKYDQLNKGWSRDIKYILKDEHDCNYLLRVFERSLYDRKREQFELLKKMEKLNLPCSKVIDFGILNEKQAYMVLTWLEGESADEVVSRVSDKEAYHLGAEAGKILKKLHEIDIVPVQHTWWEQYQEKIPRKIAKLEACQLPFSYKDAAISYVREHMELVKDRPLKFSHGDYHVGNMIVHNGKIGIIDFDKNTIADPYDEFKPFCWNVFTSEYFEAGLINGYFEQCVPDDFFPILALYAAESMISQLPWAETFGEEEVKTAYKVADHVMEWFDGFNRVVPTWYKGINFMFEDE